MATVQSTTHPDELAAPLDLLLKSATRPIVGRMMPNQTWARFGARLARQPRAVATRGGELASELATIAVGKSDREPGKSDKRFADPAWQHNPLLHRIMQAYLAAASTVDGLFDDADLDWRDADRMRFVLDNIVEGLAPSNNPVISPLGWKALIDTGGLSAVRGAKALARDLLSKPRAPAMVEPDAFSVGETVATTQGAVVLKTLDQNRAGFASAAMSDRAARAAIRSSAKQGYLDGRAMAEMFARLRPTDLVWRYWVNNYVQGRPPAAFRRALLERRHHPHDCRPSP